MRSEFPNVHRNIADATHRLGQAMPDKYIYEDCVEVYVFPQMWPSTALGFGGVGGASMTEAYTTIVHYSHSRICLVYFAETFAYSADFNLLLESGLMHRNAAPSYRDLAKFALRPEDFHESFNY